MSEKRLNNTIFLMYMATESYKKKHCLSYPDFMAFDKKHQVLNYISDCPDIFDSMTKNEMAEEIEQYASFG